MLRVAPRNHVAHSIPPDSSRTRSHGVSNGSPRSSTTAGQNHSGSVLRARHELAVAPDAVAAHEPGHVRALDDLRARAPDDVGHQIRVRLRALEREQLAGLVRGRDLERQLAQDADDLRDLVGVRLRQLALRVVEAVLEADPHVAPHDRPDRDETRLVATGAENRPDVGVPEQAIRGPAHVQEVIGLGTDAAKDPEHRLHEQGRLDEAAVEEVGERVQVPDVVALELEAGAVLAQLADDLLDVLEGVLEDPAAGVLEEALLPVEAEALDRRRHREHAEVHRAHVQGAELGLEAPHRTQPLVERHAGGPAGGDVDHGTAGLSPYTRQEGRVGVRIGGRAPGLRVASVEMENRRALARRTDRGVCDLVARDRQVRALRGDVHRAGDGAADDYPGGTSHSSPPLLAWRRSVAEA